MKLATYQDGSRDGQLVVVARDLVSAHYATGIADQLQQALDDWNFIGPQLQDLYDALNAGRARHAFPFDPTVCLAPLPRAYQWACADDAAEAVPAADADRQPGLELLLQPGDALAGPCAAVPCRAEAGTLQPGAGLAVVTADIAAGATPEQALDGVRLLLLVNRLQLPADGCSAVQRVPMTAFGPVAVTPDECGAAWERGRLRLPLRSELNRQRTELPDAGDAMPWHFGELIAHLAATRRLSAGAIVGSGTLRALAAGRAGKGTAGAPALGPGDHLRIEMHGSDGQSLFGAIDQDAVAWAPPAPRHGPASAVRRPAEAR